MHMCTLHAPCMQSAIFAGRYSKVLGEEASLLRAGFCGMNQVVSGCCCDRPQSTAVLL